MRDPVDPMHTAGRWLVRTASGATHLVESVGPDGAVTATRVSDGPRRDDPRFPLAELRRDGDAMPVVDIQHLTGTTYRLGIVVGEDMYLFLEPCAESAVVTLRRTTPVVQIEAVLAANRAEVASDD